MYVYVCVCVCVYIYIYIYIYTRNFCDTLISNFPSYNPVYSLHRVAAKDEKFRKKINNYYYYKIRQCIAVVHFPSSFSVISSLCQTKFHPRKSPATYLHALRGSEQNLRCPVVLDRRFQGFQPIPCIPGYFAGQRCVRLPVRRLSKSQTTEQSPSCLVAV